MGGTAMQPEWQQRASELGTLLSLPQEVRGPSNPSRLAFQALALTRRLLSLDNLSPPQDQLYKEMRGRIQEADQSAPIRWVKKWWSAARGFCV